MPVEPDIHDYIEKAKAAGFSDEAIREELVKAGWNPLDVKMLLPASVPALQPAPPKRFSYLSAALAILALVALIIAYLYVEKRGPFAVPPEKQTPLELEQKIINSLSPEDSEKLVAALEEQRKKSRDARSVAMIQNTNLSLLIYYDTNGTYPLTLDTLVEGGLLPRIETDSDSSARYEYAYNPYTRSDWKLSDVPATQCSSAKPCKGYHLGISLELNNPTVMERDGDMVATGFSGAINGSDSTPCLSSHTAGNHCFDLVGN